MPVARMRMRPWLEKMIESNSITGLSWVDKEKFMFSIPWKHAARHGWEVDKDASLFKKWAIHTGKYIEGQTAADPKTWKANFRCAMNSLPDIEEVKDRSINKGHQAMRVYRMLEAPTKLKDKRSKTNQTRRRRKNTYLTSSEDMDYSDRGSPTECHTPLHDNTVTTQENTVDSTVDQDLPYLSTTEVPEWVTSVEIDSTSDLLRRFEVSPEHSPGYEEADMITLCQQLELEELDQNWLKSSSDSTGYLSNEAYTDSSYSSPGSQWSDNSADELEQVYAILGTSHSNDLFKFPSQINCCQ